MDTGEQTDQYIPRLFWTPTGQLGFYRLNRLQNHFEVLLCDSSGRPASCTTSATTAMSNG